MISKNLQVPKSQFSRADTISPRKSGIGHWLLVAAIGWIAVGVPAHAAVNREITINAPAMVTAGSKVTITISARTDAGGGERIGFFHADYSTDSGVTWTAISYSTNSGPKVSYSTSFIAKDVGPTVRVRVRVAYRGGKAGDVDYTGKAIDWDGSWNRWLEPPAKFARIVVGAK